jgi:hypothetical protein
MTEALRRNKFVLIILSLIIFITFLVLTLLLRKPEKIPSKGIFVLEAYEENCEGKFSVPK